MSTSRRLIFTLVVVMALSACGCKWFRRTPAPKPPPVPVVTKPEPPPVAQPVVPEPALPAPQPEPPRTEEPAPQPAPPPAQPPPVVHPPKPKTEPRPAPPTQPARPPAFGQILTPQQQAEFRSSYQQSAQFVRQTLNQLSGRALSSDQAETANRIRTFLRQADESLARDLAAASQFARRAEILARSLLD